MSESTAKRSLLDQAHGDARDRPRHRHAASISDSDAPHTVAIDDEPFDSVISDTTRMVYGKLVLGRQQRTHRAPGQLPWPISRRPGVPMRPVFADRVRREVVVEHEVLAVLALERVDDLLVLAGAQRCDDQRLGFAAGEIAEPCARGSTPTSAFDRAHGLVSRPSIRCFRQDLAAHDFAFRVSLNSIDRDRSLVLLSVSGGQRPSPWPRRAVGSAPACRCSLIGGARVGAGGSASAAAIAFLFWRPATASPTAPWRSFSASSMISSITACNSCGRT